MHLVDKSGDMALIRLPLDWGESGHPLMLEILPDFKHWCLSLALHVPGITGKVVRWTVLLFLSQHVYSITCYATVFHEILNFAYFLR